MRILEVRDGFVKIESEKRVYLSSFLEIKSLEKSYIAQIIQVKQNEEVFFAFAKILFLFNGSLQNYDKTLPDKNSEIADFTDNILNMTLNYEIPVVAGKFIENDYDILVDKKFFDKKMLISIDTVENANTIISNLSQQFKKHIIIDMTGRISGKKFKAGVDFKLPLNTSSLEFMYEDCLNDATSESKSLIKEIFNDLSEYSKTVSFLPFGTLKTIVDNMVDKEHVFKLLVLKNKLAKFDRLGCFAAQQAEAENLEKILNLNSAIIDLSGLDVIFQNRYLQIIYSFLEKEQKDTQVFVDVSNSIDKKNIKNVISNPQIASVFVTHSKFKYLNDIKSMFDNFIIEPSFTNNEIFKIYSTFLNAMPKSTYLIVGEGTNYIPLAAITKKYFAEPAEEIVKQEPETEINESLEEIFEQVPVEDTDSSEEGENEEIIEEVMEDTAEEEDVDDKSVEEDNLSELQNEIFSDDEEPEIIEEPEVVTNIIEEEPQIEDNIQEETPEAEVLEIEEEEDIYNDEIAGNTEEIIPEEDDEEFHTEVDDSQTIEIPEDISDLTEDFDLQIEPEQEIEEVGEIEGIIEESAQPELREEIKNFDPDEIKFRDYSEKLDLQEGVKDVIPLGDSDDELEELVELDESEDIGDDTILVDFTDDDIEEEEDLDTAIVKDVDKVFTTMKDDTISDSDLDFIDELNESEEVEVLNEGMEELTELEGLEDDDEDNGFLEPLDEVNSLQEPEEEEKEVLQTRNTSTPIVPVYDADIPQEDLVISDPIEQGDTVTHAKYGVGVVEKMIKYGTKTLYSINFENVGRRLLDPAIAEIKKA